MRDCGWKNCWFTDFKLGLKTILFAVVLNLCGLYGKICFNKHDQGGIVDSLKF